MSGIYTQYKRFLVNGLADIIVDDIRCIPLSTGYTFDATHLTLADVPLATRYSAVTPVVLGSKLWATFPDRVAFDANDVTFPAMNETEPVGGFLIYNHTDDTIVAYIDNAQNLPLQTDGRDVVVVWSNESNRIFSW